MSIIKEWINSRKLIFELAKNDFGMKFAGSFFGILWAFVQPVVTVLLYVFVFQIAFKAGPTSDGFPYVLWLIAGLCPWLFFNEALVSASNCFLDYSYLVKKVVFPISVLPAIKIISALFIHAFFIVTAIYFNVIISFSVIIIIMYLF